MAKLWLVACGLRLGYLRRPQVTCFLGPYPGPEGWPNSSHLVSPYGTEALIAWPQIHWSGRLVSHVPLA